jgi:tRNA G18 (ribose-2'-O)-methylase SpoU
VDARADLYRGVSDGELLRAHGLFVAEGRLVVRRVIESGRFRLHSLLVNEAARRGLADAIGSLPPEVPVIDASIDQFRALTGFNVHRGCLALVHRPRASTLDEVLARPGAVLMLEGVANADNVGGIFRNAAAFGAAGVLLDARSCDPLYRKAVRTSMGAVLRVPNARIDSWPHALARVRSSGRVVVALHPRDRAIPIDEFAVRQAGTVPAFVLGAEGEGLSDELLAGADACVKIPMASGIDSLNVAVAAAVALFRARSQG